MKLVILFTFCVCDWILGSWKQVYNEKPFVESSDQQYASDSITFKSDGNYILITPWQVINGKWILNDQCDSLSLLMNTEINHKNRFLSGVTFISDTLRIQYLGREENFSKFYVKIP